MKLSDVHIKSDLNPSNCDQQGYVWFQDVIFDPEAPEIANRDILEILETGDYALGLPAINARDNNFVGLYKKAAV